MKKFVRIVLRETHQDERMGFVLSRLEQSRLQSKAWYARNRIRKLAYNSAHRKSILAAKARYRKRHREKLRAENRLWQKRNPVVCSNNSARRYARKLKATGCDYTNSGHIKARWQMWGGRCYICGSEARATDHVKPLAKGGSHFPSNLRPICVSCNSKKSDAWPFESAQQAMPEDSYCI